jgi:hypothetical protein
VTFKQAKKKQFNIKYCKTEQQPEQKIKKKKKLPKKMSVRIKKK